MAADPLHQFYIVEHGHFNLLGTTIQVTNQAVWMVGATLFMAILFIMGVRKKAIVPSRLQSVVELVYEFIRGTVEETAGTKALKYMPVIFTVFLFVTVLNVVGMIPHSYTSTSQIFITGFMALCIFIAVVLIGFATHGLKFLSMFIPKDVPILIAPMMIVLELISFFIRPFTLSIRLAANMMAGHIAMKVFASFIISILSLGGIWAIGSVIPLAALLALTGLELFVAFLQAYIFTLISCVYLNEALHLH